MNCKERLENQCKKRIEDREYTSSSCSVARKLLWRDHNWVDDLNWVGFDQVVLGIEVVGREATSARENIIWQNIEARGTILIL